MPLVTPLDASHDPETRELAAFFNETLGFCPNSVLTMQRRPAISKAFINLNKAVMANEGRVTSALKRMIAWVSSNATGCRYCQAHAIRAAERYGAEQEQLDNIWEYRTHAAFNDAERAALDFSLAASQVPNAVNQDIQDRLHQHWDEGEIVEMLGVISLFGYLNRWNDSMGTTLEQDAIDSGDQYLGKHGFEVGKHV
ncbi:MULTISPECIES: carboxymuconolactone decarboxylase family protein [Nonlabens]|uniref:Peroxidase n=3 Tax=Nonlabens TaxID=363408 RepID=A0A081D7V0_NONUL|nr:carboxymuconolactone decarboxylase family protein [Nonlabens ulvanivorans]EAS20835.1 carboxymuconolactone decarboxylase [Flavobacteria bacterium BBFL7]MBF4985795.1 carboxymuconolactone decarboxylase family protein [Nonlabens mediterrranea]KEZ92272.1 peroxidase [Nonlabens ulvanivorans]PRX15103.1 putative peroxidase-related enzyme [Nonlabens ulvanivorans]GAK74996.1 probable fusion protein [Nonlabens ulvanivorans]